jgi:hypothetical protein
MGGWAPVQTSNAAQHSPPLKSPRHGEAPVQQGAGNPTLTVRGRGGGWGSSHCPSLRFWAVKHPASICLNLLGRGDVRRLFWQKKSGGMALNGLKPLGETPLDQILSPILGGSQLPIFLGGPVPDHLSNLKKGRAQPCSPHPVQFLSAQSVLELPPGGWQVGKVHACARLNQVPCLDCYVGTLSNGCFNAEVG